MTEENKDQIPIETAPAEIITEVAKKEFVVSKLGKMNLKTGIITYFEQDKEPDKLSEVEIFIFSKPNRACHKCYGRGYIGEGCATGFKIACKCVKPLMRKIGFRQVPKAEAK